LYAFFDAIDLQWKYSVASFAHSLFLWGDEQERATDLPPSAKIFTEKLLLLFNREEDPVDLLGSRYRNLRRSRGSIHGSCCSNIAHVGLIRAQLFALSPFYVSLMMALSINKIPLF
jgi:hypothetical protein